MHRVSLPPDRNAIVGCIVIQRSVQEVFGYYFDFGNLPHFLGDVLAVQQITPATSRWTIQGPFGIRAHRIVKLTERRTNELIRFETVSSPRLKTYWEIHFTPRPDRGETEVREVMKGPLGRIGRAALALIGKFPEKEVCANLRRLGELLETGVVIDSSYAVAGKFPRACQRDSGSWLPSK
jgi:uncharacterized membrane protein